MRCFDGAKIPYQLLLSCASLVNTIIFVMNGSSHARTHIHKQFRTNISTRKTRTKCSRSQKSILDSILFASFQ